jgi:desulfoferrodoxin-like iron-binding protein
MKTYVCQICGHIAFDQAPVDCPVCGMPIENFENIPGAIKKPLNPESISEEERKHIPMIQISGMSNGPSHQGCLDIHIKIGEDEHEMLSEHFISFIDLYLDKKYIMRTLLTPRRIRPAINLHLNIHTGRLAVISNCNIHGSWITKVTLDEPAVS